MTSGQVVRLIGSKVRQSNVAEPIPLVRTLVTQGSLLGASVSRPVRQAALEYPFDATASLLRHDRNLTSVAMP